MLALTATDPRRVGPFRILGRLGAGGMGIVYAGQDSTGRKAAVKVVHAQLAHDPAFRGRFAREAVLLGRVDGACTARVLAADVDADPPYLALEFVEGPTLAEHVTNQGALSPGLLLPLATGLAEALLAIHAVGVVHRDLKPANVVLSASGPKVIDFGVAYLADATSLTTSGLVLGSPGWMAPEQFAADQVTTASDVFAWAATVLYAATGKLPFGGGSVEAVYYRILNTEPDLTDVAEPLRSILARAFAKVAAERPSVPELLTSLYGHESSDPTSETTALLRRDWQFAPAPTEQWPAAAAAPADGLTVAEHPGGTERLGYPAAPPRRSRRWLATSAAGLILAAGVGGGVYLANQPAATLADTAGESPAPVTPTEAATTSSAVTTAPATTAPATAPTAAAPKPPYFQTNPVCAGVRCTLLGSQNGIRTDRGRLRLELIGLPIPDGGSDPTLQPTYLALYDEAGQLLYTSSEVIGAYLGPNSGERTDGIQTDEAGRIFVPFVVGAHSGQLVVLDANTSPVEDFGSMQVEGGGRFTSSSPGVFAVDIDGDGINEIVLEENDYKPSYAEGTTYERYYGYQDADWQLLGCTKLTAQTTVYNQGPKIRPGGPGCER